MNLPPILLELTKGENAPSEQMLSEYFDRLERRKYKSKTKLLDIGDQAEYIYFVIDGAVANVFKDHEGELQASHFVGPNDGISCIDSFLFDQPAQRGLITTSKTEVILFSKEDFEYLNKLYPELKINLYRLFVKSLSERLDLRNSLMPMDATQRYKFYNKQFEDIKDYIPLNFVSSYLGVRQQSLSRIRAQLRSA